MCKIMTLGTEFAFAETGREGYRRDDPLDPVPEWNGKAEALNAYKAAPDADLYQVALRWAIQITNDFTLFYRANPSRVRALAGPQGTLLLGLFLGKDKTGALNTYLARIAFDETLIVREGAQIPIGYAVDSLLPTDKPYSTNAVTQELLQGKTVRANEAAKRWARNARRVRKGERELRRLEFLIERTSDYDEDVHGPINVVEIGGDSVTWIQNSTCKTAR
jgi:hypothetical protein